VNCDPRRVAGRLHMGGLVLGLCLGSVGAQSPGGTAQVQLHWYKGNTHTHTLMSDGDSLPDEVVRWYAEHGYDFVVLTDHAVVDNVDPLNALFNADGQFLVIRGEEVTSNFDKRSVHVNALNPAHAVDAQRGADARDTLQKDLDAAHSVAPLAQINHPTWRWQLSAKDIASVKGGDLLEIANQHPGGNNLGAGPQFPGTEEIWDEVLSQGVHVWGVASDDSHVFKRPWSSDEPLPGRGWIVVRAAHLTVKDIIGAIKAGDFYASTGVELRDYQASPKLIGVTIRPSGDRKYRVQFIGKNGRVFEEATGNSALYQVKGDEGYVRAKITDSDGKMAWTQPVFLSAPQPR
jgi:hypothetical protein